MVLLLLIHYSHDCVFSGGLCLILVLLCSTKCPFELCNHLAEEERAGCFTLIVLLCHLTVIVLSLFLMVPWVGLQCVIVAFLVKLTYFLC